MKTGDKVAAYYPVSRHLAWVGFVKEIRSDKALVKSENYENLSDWFNRNNVVVLPPERPAREIPKR